MLTGTTGQLVVSLKFYEAFIDHGGEGTSVYEDSLDYDTLNAVIGGCIKQLILDEYCGR